MRALAVNAGELAKRIDELHKSVDEQTKEINAQNKRNARKIHWMAVTVVLLAAVGVLVAIGYVRQGTTSDRQDASEQEQEISRSDVSCPILSDLLGGYDPSTRAPGRDRDVYERNKALERTAFTDRLHCQTDMVPPRSDLVTKPAK